MLVVDTKNAFDKESASSNALSQALGLKGEVLIGNKALQFYYSNPKKDFIDLAALWYEKTLAVCFWAFVLLPKQGFLQALVFSFQASKNKNPLLHS